VPELAAAAVVATRKYRIGRVGAARCLARAIAEVLGEADAGRIWLDLQKASEGGWGLARFWMMFWWIGRGNPPAAAVRHPAALEDVLADPNDPRIWDRSR
jgi:hypothetical protein